MSSCQILITHDIDWNEEIETLVIQRIENKNLTGVAEIISYSVKSGFEKNFIQVFRKYFKKKEILDCYKFHETLKKVLIDFIQTIIIKDYEKTSTYANISYTNWQFARILKEIQNVEQENFEDLIITLYSELYDKILGSPVLLDLSAVTILDDFSRQICKFCKVVIVKYTYSKKGFKIYIPSSGDKLIVYAIEERDLKYDPNLARQILDKILKYQIIEVEPGAKRDLLETLFFFSML